MSVRLSFISAFVMASTLTCAAHAEKPTTAACLDAHESSVDLGKRHDLLGARAQLRRCVDDACPKTIRDECTARLAEIDSAVPTLLVEVKSGTDEDVPGATVTLDGRLPALRVDGIPLESNPGDHVVLVEAAGFRPLTKNVTLQSGEKGRRLRVILEPASQEPTPLPPPPSGAPPPVQGSSWSTHKTLAVIAGAVGVGAFGIGTGFGISARTSWSRAERDCPTTATCSDYPGAVSAKGDAETSATISTVAFGVGAAACVAAVVLWLVAPSTRNTGAAPWIRGAF
jgi:hypothetical protein